MYMFIKIKKKEEEERKKTCIRACSSEMLAVWPVDLLLSWATIICMHHRQLFNVSIASEGIPVQTQFTLLAYQTSFFKDIGPTGDSLPYFQSVFQCFITS